MTGRYLGWWLVAAMLSLAWPSFGAEPGRNLAIGKSGVAEKRVALVIGNAAYPGAPLKNPVNDAKDMATTLRRLGFEVISKTDVTQKEMNRAIAQFGEKLRADTVALFYYAGHGMQVKGKNYLIPIDAQIASEASARAETVDVDTVMDQLAVSTMNVVVLDACRNNPFERKFRSAGGGLAQMDAPRGSLIAYATAPGKVAADGEGRNGLYTRELLRHIQTPGLPLEAVFKRVRNAVMQSSGEAQTPWEASSLTGDFYFRPGDGSAAPTTSPLAAPADNSAVEIAFWESIKNSTDNEDFESYLNRFPNGQFAELAERRIRKKPATAPAAKPLASQTSYWESPDGSSFTLRLDGNKVSLTRTKGGDDINVLNVAFKLYPGGVSLPLVISGVLEDTRFAGEYRQDGGFLLGNTNCNVPERRGRIEGSIDPTAGAVRLTYDRTTLHFETEFASIFSDKFVCRITDRKLTPAFVLQLTPARPDASQAK
jgi:uncharacterized caspase-like protein